MRRPQQPEIFAGLRGRLWSLAMRMETGSWSPEKLAQHRLPAAGAEAADHARLVASADLLELDAPPEAVVERAETSSRKSTRSSAKNEIVRRAAVERLSAADDLHLAARARRRARGSSSALPLELALAATRSRSAAVAARTTLRRAPGPRSRPGSRATLDDPPEVGAARVSTTTWSPAASSRRRRRTGTPCRRPRKTTLTILGTVSTSWKRENIACRASLRSTFRDRSLRVAPRASSRRA